jgi:hypothetical protein
VMKIRRSRPAPPHLLIVLVTTGTCKGGWHKGSHLNGDLPIGEFLWGKRLISRLMYLHFMGTCHFDNKTSSLLNADASVKVVWILEWPDAFIASSRRAAGKLCWPLGAPRLFPVGLVTRWLPTGPN